MAAHEGRRQRDDGVDAGERARRIAHPTAQRVLAVARQMLGDRGLAATSAVGVERAAGVATGTVRYYFGTRDRLLEELLRTGAETQLNTLREQLEPAATLADVEQAIVAVVDPTAAETPMRALPDEVGAGAPSRSPLATTRELLDQRHCAELARLLDAKAAAGIVALPAPAKDVATFLLALKHGLAVQAATRPSWDPAPALTLTRTVARRLLSPATD